MRCHEFWAKYLECNDSPTPRSLDRDLTEHLAACAACRAEAQALEELDVMLRRGLVAQAEASQPRPAAVSAAVAAAVAAARETQSPRSPARAPQRDRASLRFIAPAPVGWLRWAAAAALIAAAGLLGQGQPWGATSTYAEATATARAATALPSPTPSATLSVGLHGTPAAVSLAPVTSTPSP
ncbi:MAG: hypothetical protein U0641_16140 [Anaerolineae bacterium]